MRSLFLFDIDSTLLTTDGAGMRAMAAAGRWLCGPGFSADGVDYAGRLDPAIIEDLLVVNGVSSNPELLREFRARYVAELDLGLVGVGRGRMMPGVDDLLRRLEARRDAVLGLLTGNIEEGGLLKMAASGIDASRFVIRVWGDSPWREGNGWDLDERGAPPSRNDLPPVACAEYARVFGQPIEPSHITIIGDTPHDVACARVNGCRSLGVATGRYSMEELASAGADRVVADLSSVDDVLTWLVSQ